MSALSAGTHAKTAINPMSTRALAELGIDISGHRPTQLSTDLVSTADLVVILGTEAHIDIDPPPHRPHLHRTLGHR